MDKKELTSELKDILPKLKNYFEKHPAGALEKSLLGLGLPSDKECLQTVGDIVAYMEQDEESKGSVFLKQRKMERLAIEIEELKKDELVTKREQLQKLQTEVDELEQTGKKD